MRFWVEAAIASVCGFLAVLTLFVRAWVEVITGFDPDHGNGSFEWTLVAALAFVCALLGVAARHEWRRSRASAGALA